MRVEVGTVFALPLRAGLVAFGQVAWRRQKGPSDYLMVVFEGEHLVPPLPDPSSATERRVILQALTFDSLIRDGRWATIGVAPVPSERIWLPEFKVMVREPNTYEVVDMTLTRLRRATKHEVDTLPTLRSVSPLHLELAAQAKMGMGELSEIGRSLLAPTTGIRLIDFENGMKP